MVLDKARFYSLSSLFAAVLAFDVSRFDNTAVYWGQNSYGATNTDVANFQKPIDFYCEDDAIDVIPVAFVDTFFGTGGLPVMNLANTCNNVDNATFPGSELPNCTVLAPNIEACQAKGKVVTISLGGAGGTVGFSSDDEATTFADQIWDLFLGGSSPTRPFGSAVLDGVDLDIENGGSSGYAAFISQLQTHFQNASKPYFISGAPQCVFPDASLGSVLNTAWFDMVYVQFYNNPCGLQNFNASSQWDYGLWDNWARTMSPNPNVKIFIGAPASSTAAGGGYQPPNVLANIASITRNSFPSFGGVMLWDASQAYANDRYDLAIKNALVAAGATGFTFPPCTAPAFVSGQNYPGGSEVSSGGYIWQAKWYASDTPANNPNSDWSAVSACSGTPPSSPTSVSTNPPSSTSSSTPSSSSSSHSTQSPSSVGSAPQPTQTLTGNCAGISAWNSTAVYTGGDQVTFDNDLWTAQWWTEGDTPGGSAGVWTNDGTCTATTSTKSDKVVRRNSRIFRI